MKLKITNVHTHLIHEKFGIGKQRMEELFDFVEQQYNKAIRDGVNVKLVTYYTAIADFCNNIEEYTLCMHCFIFNLSGVGKPADSNEFKN